MIQEWVVEWFIKEAKVERQVLEQNLNIGYLEAGYIDSMEFIALISDVEEKFGIQFNDEDFMDEKILTIAGLIDRIEKG